MPLETTALRLNALRAEMSRLGLDALIVPRFDAHQGEYVAPHDARLAWLTGFTGSAGMAVVTPERAEMFVDGRYTVQVQTQCAGPDFGYHHLIETPPDRWLAEADPAWRVGYDPMLLSPNWADWMTAALGDRLVALDANPVDTVWPDQPAPPQGPVTPFPMQYAGRSSTDKRDGLLAQMAREGADFAVETQPDNIAWLLNVRGRDVDYNPIPQSFLLLAADGQASWFIDPSKLTADLDDHLPDWITPRPVQAFLPDLAATVPAGATVLLDPDFSPAAVVLALDRIGAQARRVPGPVTLAKAIKNRVELAGMRAAHLADGVAWTEFSAALPRTLPTTEAEAEALMERLRAQQPGFVMPSFKSISASSGNAAMCHYATGPGRDAPLTAGMTYLLDSGGQYDTGTTDATRCFAFGPVSDDYRRAYTAVFRALHAMMTLRFPPSTRGHHIDAICRRPLWDLGMDYDHGTGHGVGHQLSVHEHPQRIGRLVNAVDLVPGMILTIEPGHYVAGQYGIRIENQVEVVEEAGGFMSFANLTFAPIQTDMLDLSRLTADERAWLVRYNAAILTRLGPQLSDAARKWTIANGALLE